jgi:cytoskeletal protein RodZ
MGRARGERSATSPAVIPEPPLGERLAAARERKGVDLYRAERDTKIRAKYLGALERGDFRDLPGSVYTKGFLRNYALYLGLDPEDVLRQWRRERGESITEPIAVVPRSLEAPRAPVTIGRGAILAALLAVGVIIFAVYLGAQLLRFSQPPSVSVTQPLTAVTEVDAGATTYTLRGTANAGATVSIDTPGRDTIRVSAGSDGRWSADVELRRGRNQFDVTATDPDTGKTTPTPSRVYITVPFSGDTAPALILESPADGATFENGAIPVTGTASNAVSVTVSAAYLGPAAGAPAGGGDATVPPAPKPATVEVSGDGAFSVPVELGSGRWTLTITAKSAGDVTTTLERKVTVSYAGVSVVVTLDGGKAWLKVWVDGKVDKRTGAGGKTFADGKSVTFSGKQSVEIRTGNPSVTKVTVNGTDLGPLDPSTDPGTWLIEPPDPPARTDRT